jgi:hypothetical protein
MGRAARPAGRFGPQDEAQTALFDHLREAMLVGDVQPESGRTAPGVRH